MKTFKEFVVPTITLCIICLVAAALLGLTNKVTSPKIEQLAIETQQNAMKEVLPDASDFGEESFDSETGCTYAQALDANGNIIGYAVTSIGKGGYGGDISAMVGIDASGNVTLVSILSQSETASIGGKLVSQETFLNRFIGLSGSVSLTKNGGTVDAVSGATKTSTGITDAVNNALICYSNVSREVSTNG